MWFINAELFESTQKQSYSVFQERRGTFYPPDIIGGARCQKRANGLVAVQMPRLPPYTRDLPSQQQHDGTFP